MSAGRTTTLAVHSWPNLASASQGATATGSTGSVNTTSLIDDDESTNWAATGQTGNVDTTHPSVSVDLAGGTQVVRQVRVSALLRPAADGDADSSPGARFTALRKFAVETCTASATVSCASPLPAGVAGSPWKRIYTSADDAFPATRPRPLSPDLQLRTFDVPDTAASDVRLVTLENQCTGTPEYAGEQDSDATNPTDCATGSTSGQSVRAAEFEVYTYDSFTRPPGDPVVVTTMSAPAAVRPGQQVLTTVDFSNAGPKDSEQTSVVASVPAGLTFVSAANGGRWDAAKRTVTFAPGTVAVNTSGSVSYTVAVPATATAGTVYLQQAQFSGALTYSAPTAAVSTVTP